MIDLLRYVKSITVAPDGTPVTASQKLALLLIIIEGGGERTEITPDRFTALLRLNHTKSLSRLLKTLADLDLISIERERTALGHGAPPVCYPLPNIKRRPGNIQVTGHEPGNIQVTRSGNIEVTRQLTPEDCNYAGAYDLAGFEAANGQKPGNIQVTGEKPGNIQVTRPISNGNKDLETPGNIQVTGRRGTAIAPHPPLNDLIEGGGEPGNIHVTRSPAVMAWLRIVGEEITDTGAKMIARRVKHVTLWEETLEGWLANPRWSKQNIDGQIERYEKKARDYTPPPEERRPVEKSDSQKMEDERIRRRMYGDE